MTAAGPTIYHLEFTNHQWEEIFSLAFVPFFMTIGDKATRAQWVAVGQMCLGKAQMIEDGYYGGSCPDEGVDISEWAQDLRDIAEIIFAKFQPGDGQI